MDADGFAVDGSAVSVCTGCLVALGFEPISAGLVAGFVVLLGRAGLYLVQMRAKRPDGDVRP